jgi:hypothetical protein
LAVGDDVPLTGTGKLRSTSRSSTTRSPWVALKRERASSTSPERQSRMTQSTSWPLSGWRPSRARITRPCAVRSVRRRS